MNREKKQKGLYRIRSTRYVSFKEFLEDEPDFNDVVDKGIDFLREMVEGRVKDKLEFEYVFGVVRSYAGFYDDFQMKSIIGLIGNLKEDFMKLYKKREVKKGEDEKNKENKKCSEDFGIEVSLPKGMKSERKIEWLLGNLEELARENYGIISGNNKTFNYLDTILIEMLNRGESLGRDYTRQRARYDAILIRVFPLVESESPFLGCNDFAI